MKKTKGKIQKLISMRLSPESIASSQDFSEDIS